MEYINKEIFEGIAENPKFFPNDLLYIFFNEMKLEHHHLIPKEDFFTYFYMKYNTPQDIQRIVAEILEHYSAKFNVPLARRVFLLDSNNNLIKELDVIKAKQEKRK